MSTLLRLGLNILKREARVNTLRTISLGAKLNLKEIHEEKSGKELVIQGVIIPSPRTELLVKTQGSECSLCATGLDVKHTDVLILSQYVRSDGCMLPRRVTGLCRRQQKRMSSLVTMAQKAGLMSNLTPVRSKKDPKMRYGWKKYNKYFDEDTIKTK